MTSKLTQQERDILQGLQEILDGHGQVITPEALKARRRGRPPLPTVKVGVKIRLDADLLGVLRNTGSGWQTRINEALRREFMSPQPASDTISLQLLHASLLEDRGFLLKASPADVTEEIHILAEDDLLYA